MPRTNESKRRLLKKIMQFLCDNKIADGMSINEQENGAILATLWIDCDIDVKYF